LLVGGGRGDDNARMSRKRRPSPHRIETYSDKTQRPLTCLAFVLPVLVLYHVGCRFVQSNLLAPYDIARLLRYFGADTWDFLPGVAVVLVLGLQHFFQHNRLELEWRVLAGMVIESVLAIIPLIVIWHVSSIVTSSAASLAATTTAPATAPATSVGRQLLEGLGAGIYEEFIFRLVFLGLALLLLVDVLGLRKRPSTVIAVLLGAVLFSLYHFYTPQDPWGQFAWQEFVFRAAAGAYLGVVFVFRGFGIAVGAHILWNVYVVLYRLGQA